ncbi:sulfatase/phosphatase domain-containing protein [Maribacter aquivivus]|nr:sulfatase/phosphatase domain-containing protein [Maribacter aquivivus]
MVTHMDARIGDIIQALKDKNIYDNTIIVFTSDHGINFGENGVAGKVCLYEPSVTAPLIIKAPSAKPNTKITSRVYLQDVVPTLFDLIDLETTDTIDFKSLVPLLAEDKETRPSIYLAMFDDQRGIISKNKKLIVYPKTGNLELYDLTDDPWETTNLSTKKISKSTITHLLTQLKEWQLKTLDKTDLSDIYSKFSI